MFVLRALQHQFGSRVSQLTVQTIWWPEKWPTKNRGSRSFPKVPKGITGLFARLERRQGPPYVVSHGSAGSEGGEDLSVRNRGGTAWARGRDRCARN